MLPEIETFITDLLGKTFTFFVLLPISLAIFAGLIVLQIRLSNNSNKLLGLVIPVTLTGVSVIISIISFAMFANTANNADTVLAGINLSAVMWTVINLVLINIPTLTMYGLYIACRMGLKAKLKKLKVDSLARGINKMSIEDL